MGKLREWWANVYADTERTGEMQSLQNSSREECDERAKSTSARASGWRQAYRIHVRLKPEGAPKRYANPHDRECWESNPKRAAVLDELFAMDLPFERANEGGGDRG